MKPRSAVENAVMACVNEGKTTQDAGGTLGTREVGDAVLGEVVDDGARDSEATSPILQEGPRTQHVELEATFEFRETDFVTQDRLCELLSSTLTHARFLEKTFTSLLHSTTVRTEILAGLTTFMTMSYIIFVQPAVLSTTGMDFGAVLAATCIVSAIGCFLMAFSRTIRSLWRRRWATTFSSLLRSSQQCIIRGRSHSERCSFLELFFCSCRSGVFEKRWFTRYRIH